MSGMHNDVLPITQLLRQAHGGNRDALNQIYELLYPDLKRVARSRLHSQGRADEMDTTVLVHETFLRLVGTKDLRLEDRRHFFAYAARTMRHIIIDSARQMLADRRGGGLAHDTLSGEGSLQVADASVSAELIRVNDALLALEAVDKDLAEVVELRYFGGYSEAEIAQQLGVGVRTVSRRWEQARAWLFANMKNDTPSYGPSSAAGPAVH